MISAIVAVDNNWGIGYEGNLLVSIPDDLKHFKEITEGNMVIMGRRTWDSLPRKPLPKRINIVITRNTSAESSTQVTYTNMEAIKLWLSTAEDNIFIIGGETIYKELLSFCDRVYVTKIHKSFDNVDTYFPNLDIDQNWAPACCSAVYEHDGLPYQFWEYDRIVDFSL